MTRLTVRAPNSTEAMEAITKELGEDAFILTTLSDNGMIEITATDDEDEAAAFAGVASKPKATPKPVVHEAPEDIVEGLSIFSKSPKMNEAGAVDHKKAAEEAEAGAYDVWSDEDIVIEPMQSHDAAPEEEAMPVETAVPVVDQSVAEAEPEETGEFAKVLRFELNAGSGGKSLLTGLLTEGRTVLVGPAGAGKALVAAQMTSERAGAGEGRTSCVFTASLSRADGALLEQKSYFAGATYQFAPLSDVPPCDAGAAQIVVASGRGPEGAAPQLPAALTQGARVVLVLPTGLRRDRVQALAAPWRAYAPCVVLSADPSEDIAAIDLAQLGELGLPFAGISRRNRMVDGLQAPDAQTVVGPSRTVRVDAKGGQA